MVYQVKKDYTYKKLVQIGRVVYIPGENKIAAICEIIDGNRALVDGPLSGVRRQALNFRRMQLTNIVIPLRHGARNATVKKVWEEAKVNEQWTKTAWAQRLKMKELRANLSDFDRFKLMKAKQARNRIIGMELKRLKKAQPGKK